ncbi:hypothetical protein Pan153_52680 [Gimesia panareensis]|uniref:Uncharacterized protein n=1 Tax=Gimesia panareensis TaxID=2527978 RepID=A0A518FW81_9PLAN|nr:hypothetical protein Pan153_52680 [Gimesia panareensis]
MKSGFRDNVFLIVADCIRKYNLTDERLITVSTTALIIRRARLKDRGLNFSILYVVVPLMLLDILTSQP